MSETQIKGIYEDIATIEEADTAELNALDSCDMPSDMPARLAKVRNKVTKTLSDGAAASREHAEGSSLLQHAPSLYMYNVMGKQPMTWLDRLVLMPNAEYAVVKSMPGFHFVLANMGAIVQAVKTGEWPDTLFVDVKAHLSEWCASNLVETAVQAQHYMADLLNAIIGVMALRYLHIFQGYDNEPVCNLLFGATDDDRPDVSNAVGC